MQQLLCLMDGEILVDPTVLVFHLFLKWAGWWLSSPKFLLFNFQGARGKPQSGGLRRDPLSPFTFSLPNFSVKFPHFFKNSPLSRHKRRIPSIGRQREESFFTLLLINLGNFSDLNERFWNFLSTNQLGTFLRFWQRYFRIFLKDAKKAQPTDQSEGCASIFWYSVFSKRCW